mgnify:CR=1 FL=1
MKKNIKIVIFILWFLLFSWAVYATVTTARTSWISKIPWQWTASWSFTTAHHRWSSHLWDTDRFTDNWDWTISDSRTWLMWQATSTGAVQTECKAYDTDSFADNDCNDWTENDDCNWCAAKEYCANLELWPYTDWRLPNIRELESIVDYANTSSNYWYETYFTLVSGYYWSSTTNAGNTSTARNLYLNYAYMYGNAKSTTSYVLCAR